MYKHSGLVRSVAVLILHEQDMTGANMFLIIKYFSSCGVCCQLAGLLGKIRPSL